MLRLEGFVAGLGRKTVPAEYYDFVIIGSGISGEQAAEILAL